MRITTIALAALLGAPVATAQVVINEVSASNWNLIADGFGDNTDWIELFNTSPAPVDLGGWHISDSQNNNLKWQFPAGATIAGNGYMVVWCNARNTSVGNTHYTNFRINQTDQERAVLTDPSGTIVSNFKLELPTKTNHSWGRTSDGATTWDLFTTATPGASNVNPSPYYAAKPVFDLEPGIYGGPISVSLTSPDAGTQIRYTLDGSTPTAASTLYAGPIAINQTTVVRAACFPTDATIPPSIVETNTYFIGVSHAVSILSVSGDQVANLFNGTQIEPIGHLEYFRPNGELRGEAAGNYNKHGNDSWAYPQRGVDWIARDEFGSGDAMRFKVFRTKNRNRFQRLILKAAASDNYPFENGGAHIRDAYVHALSHEGNLRLDERSFEPCVLYMNGQYWGVYEVREKVDDPDFTQEYYDQDKWDLQYLKTWGGTWQEYGAPQALGQWNDLRAYINANNMGEPGAFAYVESQYNWKSLVDYFVLNSYIVSKDWLNWNTGWWRGLNPLGDGRRWRYTLWDMDACFGHYVNFTNIPDASPNADPCNVENLPNPGGQGHTVILQKLIAENTDVRTYYVNRYIDLGNTVFSCNNMLPFLDSLVNLIAPEMPGHVARWGGSMAGWQNNVLTMRNFIETRCTTIQSGLIDCYELEGPFDMVFNVYPPESGRIRINSITPDTYPFNGIYYGGITTTLAAIPETDWAFSHWEVWGPNTLLPSLTDSLVIADFVAADSIVAWFVPPVRHEILLDVFPRGGGTITFNNTTYEQFPVLVSVPEELLVDIRINPTRFHEFLYWTVKNATYLPDDSTATTLQAAFFTTDTIVAFLKPEEHVYFVPNAFTPNGDGINDFFLPLGNVVRPENYDLSIYDRWGQLLYQSRDPSLGWDGTSGGAAMPDGVYVYRAYVVDDIKGDRFELFGHVTLFR